MKAPAYRYLELEVPGEGLRKVRVPRTLRRAVLPPSFVDSVFEKVTPMFRGDRGVVNMDLLETDRGFTGKIMWKVLDGTLYWSVVTDGPILACGVFITHKPKWQEMLAAAKPEARGKGLYRAVLLSLRKNLGRPLISDAQLSDANILVWSKVGKVDEARGRFKINPGPSQGAISAAWSLVALEAR
jgi:hypothetical protein